jgi:hypothetical protein
MNQTRLTIYILLLIAIPGALTAATGDTAPATNDVRLSLAQDCEEKLYNLKARQVTEPLVISGEELNAYLVVNQDIIFNSSARDIRVNLKKNRLHFRAIANLDKANLKMDSFLASAFKWIFSGDHEVEAVIAFKSDNYQGRYMVESLRIGGVPLPALLVDSLAEQVGHRQRPRMIPNQPFELPYSLKRCDIVADALVCYPGKR